MVTSNLESRTEQEKYLLTQFKLAQNLLEKNDIDAFKAAFQIFQTISDNREDIKLSSFAKYNLAVCYEKGIGVIKSLSQAAIYYFLAVFQYNYIGNFIPNFQNAFLMPFSYQIAIS